MRVLIANPAQDMPLLLDAVICRCAGMERKAGERLPPIGLAYITSALKQAGHDATLVDCSVEGITPEKFSGTLRRHKPELVISITGKNTEKQDMRYLRLAKGYGSTTALCGGYPTVAYERLLKNSKCTDFILAGEPEETAVELANALERAEKTEKIRGLAYLKNGLVKTTTRRALIRDLDSLPFPARECLQNKAYTSPYSKRGVQTVIISSRGCPHDCAFCTKKIHYGNSYRCRSAKNTVDEIEEARQKYGISDFSFQDDNFTQKRKRVVEICKEIRERGLDIAWQCTSRADCVDLDMLKNMGKAGCYLLKYGIESGNEKVLQKMRKNITLAQAEKAVKQTKKAGMLAGGTFIIGSPWDSPKAMTDTILFASRLPLDYASFSRFENLGTDEPAPGSPALATLSLWAAYLNFYLAPSRLAEYLKEPKKSGMAAKHVLRYLIKKWNTA